MNPPKASHFGGIWERAIGSVRKVIDSVLLGLNSKLLNIEEFRALLARASQIVNSTPLWQVSDSPNEPFPLTPSMLLTQRESAPILPLGDVKEEDITAYGPNRWRRINVLSDRLWQEWRRHYLYNIGTKRPKWTNSLRNAIVGDVVLIKDKNMPRDSWSTGTITGVRVSDDGLVRSASIRPRVRQDKSTTKKVRDRPIHDLILLEKGTEAELPSTETKTESCPPAEIEPAPAPPVDLLWTNSEEKTMRIQGEVDDLEETTKCPGCGHWKTHATGYLSS